MGVFDSDWPDQIGSGPTFSVCGCVCVRLVCAGTHVCCEWVCIVMSMYVFECLCYSQVGPRSRSLVCSCFGFSGEWQALCLCTLCLVGTHTWLCWCLRYLTSGLGACHPRSSSTGTYDCTASNGGYLLWCPGSGIGIVNGMVALLSILSCGSHWTFWLPWYAAWIGLGVTESQSFNLVHPLADLYT